MSEIEQKSHCDDSRNETKETETSNDGFIEKIKFIDASKKEVRITERVIIPVKEFPKFNFVGKILGTGGSNLRLLMMKSNTKISLLGNGSVRESKAKELLECGDPKFQHLKMPLHARIDAMGMASEAHMKIANAIRLLQPFLVPDGNASFEDMNYMDPIGMENDGRYQNYMNEASFDSDYGMNVSNKMGMGKYMNSSNPLPFSNAGYDDSQMTYGSYGSSMMNYDDDVSPVPYKRKMNMPSQRQNDSYNPKNTSTFPVHPKNGMSRGSNYSNSSMSYRGGMMMRNQSGPRASSFSMNSPRTSSFVRGGGAKRKPGPNSRQ